MTKKLFLLFAAVMWLYVCKAEGDGTAGSPYLIQ
jgi:hypothetical protein